MKNIKNIIITICIVVFTLFILFIIITELYVWHSHGYKPDYNLRQKCIEVSPLSDEELDLCRELKNK